MDQPEIAFNNFVGHAKTANLLLNDSSLPQINASKGDLSVIELGPGDSLFTGVIAKTLGASRSVMVDVGAYATTDITAYLQLINFLREKGYSPPSVNPSDTLKEILDVCNSEYLTNGVESLNHLADCSIDFCFSNAVLEHVPNGEFQELMNESKRVLKPDGVCVHRVDFKDHLEDGLNNLRFTEAIWEGEWFKKSGFYTNRIRYSSMMEIFKKTGFEVKSPRVIRWPSLPIKRTKLADEFRDLPEEDLLVSGADFVLHHLK